jgi:vancomycin resistance protein YoaR
MSKKQNSLNRGKNKWWLFLAALFLILVITGFGLFFWFESAYAQKFYPKTKIGNLDIGGKTKAEVHRLLADYENSIENKGFTFIAEGQEITLKPVDYAQTNPDLANPFLTFNWTTTIDRAFAWGRQGQFWQNGQAQLQSLITGKKFEVNYNLDQIQLKNYLQEKFNALEKPAQDAQLTITENQIDVSGEVSGNVFDYQKAINQLQNDIENLTEAKISLNLIFVEPKIKKSETSLAIGQIDNILKNEGFKIVIEDKKWEIKKSDYTPWLEFQKPQNQVVIGVNKDKVLNFLKPIAAEVNVEGKNAKFELKDGKVTEFQASQDGKTLNLDEAYQKISENVLAGLNADLNFRLEMTPATITTADVNDIGIKELIGRGTSNFAGSPKNRRLNIAVGAASLNGILIKPGEEFSLLKALGPIDGEHGYKQELVIKGNRTIPEYGGGLCQIGTTTFRVALRSGLPITMRRNHSYRVVYYEPAGMDATIYDPAPDLKFINDTGSNILFTTKISGDTLIFEFYGTKDGRKIEISPDPPSIFNVTSPGEPKYIETTDLAPGEKKRVETSHKGADTYFKYTVTYPNGEVKEQDFNSHYIAWPEVWLVGIEAVASTTNPLAPTPDQMPTN